MKGIRLLLLAIPLVVIIGLIATNNQPKPTATLSTPPPADSSTPPTSPFGTLTPDPLATPADTATHQTPAEAVIIKEAVGSLGLIAQRSPTAKELLKFYREHAVQSHLRPDGSVYSSESSKSDQWFAIAATPIEHKPEPGVAIIDAMFQTGPRLMIISRTTRKPISRGTIFAHELVHAMDALDGEPETPMMSEPWLMGELHAHGVTRRVLDEYTRGSWSRAVLGGDQERTAYKAAHGNKPTAYVVSFTPGDSARIVRALGPMTADDLAAVGVQYLVDVNMEVVARSAGRDSLAFAGMSVDMMKSLYGSHLPANATMQH